MPLSEGLSEEKTKGSKVWSLQPQQTGTVDGDKNCDRTTFSGGWSSESRTAEQLRVGVGMREQSKKLESTRRQLDAEKKKQTKGPRVESLNKITILEQMTLHCYYYREIYPDIWISCIESIGPWILSYRSLFLQGVYFMYLGLTLNDNSAGVRKASVHALKNLYEVDDNAPNLGRFTRRFSSQKIGLAGDFDISVAISAIDLVKQLLRHQLLPPEIRHVIGALEYEHLIAQVFNSSQFGAKGFTHLFSPCFASKRAGVRIAFVHALKNLHEIDANVPSLGRFTRRFSSQMITLSGDIDISVAISETDLVKQLLLRHQLLPPEIRHVVRPLEYEHLIPSLGLR